MFKMKQIRPKKYHLCTGFLLILFGCFMGYHIAELHERRHFEYRELSDFLASHGSGAVFNMEQCNTSAIRASAGLLAVPSTNRSTASAQYTFNKSDSVENFVLNRTTPVVETSQLISSDQIQHVYSSGELLKCKHLWKKDGKSNWFDENFNSSLKPIWSTDNIDLSTEAFSWWNVPLL
ncbi:CMP-N-acetylneuraminate-beta-galactosamide-alpha-2,3-sialyltransferase 2 [Holothuria leucospilota]|uniref:CMP-N-acetylneuraminate-beta-galactosamide-alpha-2,3-sialyltransferase 2 n=1 Tax=Holothuria leucospilota TaxID=206669 RepID=A0A9Q1CB22_HOLLE|nr:CMP-N-acetylneuraminate-beta-galactosamide-alpha-2,3-sialyltransferase 2 [Holothuria leucospilota]